MQSLEKDWVKDIYDMHTKFKVRDVVSSFDKEKLNAFIKFRLDFLFEELKEAYSAAGYHIPIDLSALHQSVTKEEDAEHLVDAMIDLCVVAIGTLDALQVDAHMSWDRVHDKNMQKEPGVKPNRPNPLGLPDLIKPTGWTSPTHVDNVGLIAKAFKND